MNEYLKPEEIEKRSMEIIASELEQPLDPLLAPIIMRVIHTTADFSYANTLEFSEGVIDIAFKALHQGVTLVSDTTMVKAGVDKTRLLALGSSIECFISDADVALTARNEGLTRSRIAIDKAANLGKPIIFVIGNAPTALQRICELNEAGLYKPELVIAVPVGFVNVVEAKERLIRSGIPYIVSRGRKGGSNVAAAIFNALLRMALA